MRNRLPRYVLISPARNEALYIEETIQSVIAQTILPVRWVIVSDGSTDGTDEVVAKYAAQYDWLELVRQPIGNLDADVSFEKDYCAFLMNKFAENPRLGVAGTPRKEGSKPVYDYRFTSIDDVSGACQMFRRECFESIDGYRAIRSGGIDYIAVLSARAKGWHTRTFTEKVCLHHRKTGSAHHTGLRERLHTGRMDYLLGSHPGWELFRGAYQMRNPPYIVGGVSVLLGYFWSLVCRVERTIPDELMQLRRREQMERLRRLPRDVTARLARRATRAVGLSARPMI